jgi:lysozyme family protein
MKNNYVIALQHVLKSEGLWSDNPADPGGATMKGITLAVYREWKRNPHISKDELRVIPDEEVYNLYKELYWNKVQGDNLPAGVDYAVFDAAVNMGVGRAAKLIQEASGVTADGVLGPASLSAIQKADAKELIEKFSGLKENFYRSLKTFDTFGKGWLRRVAEVKTFSESMLG